MFTLLIGSALGLTIMVTAAVAGASKWGRRRSLIVAIPTLLVGFALAYAGIVTIATDHRARGTDIPFLFLLPATILTAGGIGTTLRAERWNFVCFAGYVSIFAALVVVLVFH